jgi:iron complex outermembrane receptor protein
VGSENWHINANQSIAQIIDDTAVIGPYASKLAFFDLQGIEVHRGPQSTLYGLNASGGAVNFVTNKPEHDTSYWQSSLTLGREAQRDITLIGNISTNDTWALRIAGQLQRKDGVWQNLYSNTTQGGIDRFAARAHFSYQPSERQQWLLTYQHSRDDSQKVPFLFVGQWAADDPIINDGVIDTPNVTYTCPDTINTNRGFFSGSNCVTINPFTGGQTLVPDAPGYYQTYDAAEDVTYLDASQWKLSVTHDFDTWQLHSITSLDTVKSAYMESINSLASGLAFMPGQIMDNEQISQELRVSSSPTADTRWQLGAYWQHRVGYMGTIIQRYDDGGAPFGVVPSVSLEQDFDVLSIYGDLHYLLAEDWLLYAGLRYTQNDQAGDSITRVIANTEDGTPGGTPRALGAFIDRAELEAITEQPSGVCPPNIGGFPCELTTPVRLSSDLTAFNLSLSHFIEPNQQVYVQVSRGFMAGAFDTRALAAFAGTADSPVAPEQLDALEVGFKGSFDDTQVTLAAFYYDWQDKQTFGTDELGLPAFVNIPNAQLTGVELAVDTWLSDSWQTHIQVASLSTEITNNGGLPNITEGKELGQSPNLTASVSLAYNWSSDFGTHSANIGYSYVGERYGSFATLDAEFIDSYDLVNLRFTTLRDIGEQEWEWYAGIENLFAERFCYRVGTSETLGYNSNCLANDGVRQWYVGATVRF